MDKNDLLQQVTKLHRQKKGILFIAEKLKISPYKVKELLMRGKPHDFPEDIKKAPITSFEGEFTKRESVEQLEVSSVWDHEPTPDEIIRRHKIDTKKWRLATFWSKGSSKGFTVSAQFSPIKEKSAEGFAQLFTDYLDKAEFKVEVIGYSNPIEEARLGRNGVLIVNKQDAHLNKMDINGKNDIHIRFHAIENTLETLISQARHSAKIDKIVFIVGSDEFNSEWTGMTTKGTPQQNILSYEDAFEQICQHNLRLLARLYLHCQNIEVLYVKGNHDEYVGWHLIKWLEIAFNRPTVSFNTTQENRKYIRFENVGLMFNHGDQMTHKQLAQIFPMEFREEWSKCEAFNIFTGDKHHEKTEDIVGIKAYQLPALSSSKSKWDDKRGYGGKGTRAEMQVFLIEGEKGDTYIYKEFL